MAAQAFEKGDTPPGRGITFPPTAPPTAPSTALTSVAGILQAFQDYQNGTFSESFWVVFKLSRTEYKKLLDELERDKLLWAFVEDKVRYDYDPYTSELVIRMTSILHNTFIHKVVAEIEKELKRLASLHVEAQSFIEDIEYVGGRMFLPGEDDDGQSQRFKRVPDARFQHENALWPGVVIEVSYSQTMKSLVNLAEVYLLRSNGGIRVVVGLKLDYKNSKQAWFSIWRLKTSSIDGQLQGELETVVKDQLFRDVNGNPVISTSSSLELSLKDFATEDLTRMIPDLLIVLDSKTLCRLLSRAENRDTEGEKTRESQHPRMKRKWRAQTLPGDEDKIAEDELQVETETSNSDSDPTYIEKEEDEIRPPAQLPTAFLTGYSPDFPSCWWEKAAEEVFQTSFDFVIVTLTIEYIPLSNPEIPTALLSRRQNGWLNAFLNLLCQDEAMDVPLYDSLLSTAEAIVAMIRRPSSSTLTRDETVPDPSDALRIFLEPITQQFEEHPSISSLCTRLAILDTRFRFKIIRATNPEWPTPISIDFSMWEDIQRRTPQELAELDTRSVERLFLSISMADLLSDGGYIKDVARTWSDVSDNVLACLRVAKTLMPYFIDLAEELIRLRNLFSAAAVGLALAKWGYQPRSPSPIWDIIRPKDNFAGCRDFMANYPA